MAVVSEMTAMARSRGALGQHSMRGAWMSDVMSRLHCCFSLLCQTILNPCHGGQLDRMMTGRHDLIFIRVGLVGSIYCMCEGGARCVYVCVSEILDV